MKRASLLASVAAALVLTAGTAAANDAYIKQVQNDNAASIDQNGTGGVVGSSGDPVRQDGNDNDIDITQNDAGNVGGRAPSYNQFNRGVDQIGDNNALTVTQTAGSSVFEVQQDATGGGSGSGSTNLANIIQSGNMTLLRLNQTYTGDGTTGTANQVDVTQTGGTYQRSGIGEKHGFRQNSDDWGIFQTGHTNQAEITQQGAGHFIRRLAQDGAGNDASLIQNGGNGNSVGTFEQTGSNISADITQTGFDNKIGTVSQTDMAGLNTIMTVSMVGNDNGGASAFTGDAAGAAGSTLASGDFVQDGSNNQATLNIWGNNNAAALYSNGSGNVINGSVGSATSGGNDNQVAVVQNGDGNTAAFSQMGSNNNLGINQ